MQQAVAQLPWVHNIVLLTKIADPNDRVAHGEAALVNGWSRSVQVTQINRRVMQRQDHSPTYPASKKSNEDSVRSEESSITEE